MTDLRPLFAPRSVAIVGASEKNFVARSAQQGLVSFGFSGAVYPVNPRYESVLGARCYPGLSALPERVDLAIVTVNAAASVDVVEICAEIGVPAAVVMATGFGEAGEEGAELARRLANAARRGDVRLCGPGTFGLVSIVDRVAAYIAPVPRTLRPGPVAVVTQSGSLVNMVLALGDERRLGFTYAVSSGSEASLTVADYVEWTLADERTRVVAVVAEQLRDVATFVRAAEGAARDGKGIVFLKLGRSEAARRASLAHTGALVGSADAYDALFRRLGVHSVRTLDELLETTNLLAAAREPAGRRVAVISVSGGDGVLATDAAARAGVEIPSLAVSTTQAIRAIVSDAGFAANPVDTGMRPIFERGLLAGVVRAVAADPVVDLIAVRLPPTIESFRELGSTVDVSQPVVAFTRASQTLGPEWWSASEEMRVPIAQETAGAFVALRHLMDHAAFSRRAAVRAARTSSPSARLDELLARPPRVLDPDESAALLQEYGIAVAAQRVVHSPDDAGRAAEALGFPVAAKLVSPDVLHKTEIRALRLGIADAAAAASAYSELEALAGASGARFGGVLIQRMASPGLEILVGMLRDPQIGPIVVCGLGGVWAELLRDVAHRLAPIASDEAEAMLEETAVARAIGGVRGVPPGDRDALLDLLVRFSELATDAGDRLEAIDLNPVIVHERGRGATVVDARVVLRS